eukprot:1007220-Rhodomonas_salina.1
MPGPIAACAVLCFGYMPCLSPVSHYRTWHMRSRAGLYAATSLLVLMYLYDTKLLVLKYCTALPGARMSLRCSTRRARYRRAMGLRACYVLSGTDGAHVARMCAVQI